MSTTKHVGLRSEPGSSSPEAQSRDAFAHRYVVAVFDSGGNPLYAGWHGGDEAGFVHLPVGRDPFETLDPETKERMKGIVHETIESGRAQRGEYRTTQKDGRICFIEIESNILLDAGGSRSAIVVISRDVTERKSTTAGIRSMVEATSGWIWEINVDGVYSYAGPRVKDLLGYEPAEVVGRRPSEFAAPGEAAALTERLALLMAERKPIVNLETKKIHKNRAVIVVESNAVPLVDESGRLYCYQGIDRDITARRQVEDQLRKLSRVVEQSPAGIVITDRKGDIEYVNPRFCDMSGYGRDEVIGKNPRFLKSGEMPPEGYKRLWETIASGGEWRGEFHNRRKNGELYWEFASVSPIKDAEGTITHFLAVKEDVTDRKRIDEERLKLLAELQQALAKVKTLSGLLPICAWCKKVRDDEGYWKQIENYVEAHSNAEFTHGICPDCAQKMQTAQPKTRKRVTT